MSVLLGEINVNIRANNSRFNADIDQAENRGNRFSNEMSSGVLNLSQQIGAAGSSIGGYFSKVGGVMQAAGKSIQTVGANLTKYITLPLAAAGIAVFKFGKDFETELSKVIGLVGVSKEQVSSWGKEILDLAPKIGRPPKELAEALFFVTSAGIKGAEAMDVLEASGKAAAAGMGETKVIADLVTSAMNAYGKENLSASQAVDIVTNAVREGKAEAVEMASSMGQVLPLATELGVSFDQVAAAQAAMTRTGTGASEAATQLKSILAGMIKPSKQAEEQLKKMGTSSAEMRRKIREEGLLSALTDLRQMTNKFGEEAMARVYPNIRGLMGVLDLMGSNAEENAVIFENLANSSGTLDEAFKAASETLDFKWNQALSKVQATAISFFDILKAKMIPVLNTFIKVLDWVVEKFQGLSGPIQSAILAFAGIAFILGPVLLAVGTAVAFLGATFTALGTIISVVSAIITAIGWPAILAIAGAIVVAIAWITAFIGSFILLWKTNEEFRTKVLDVWNSIKENAKIIFEEIKRTVMFVFDSLKEFWGKHGKEITSILMLYWDNILNIVTFFVESIKNAVLLFGAIIRGDWGDIWEAIKNQVINIFDTINKIILEKLILMVTAINTKVDEIKTNIKTKFDEITGNIIDWIASLPEKFINGFDLIKEAVIEKFIEIKELIITKLEEWKLSITEWFTAMPEVIKELLTTWGTAIVEWTAAQNEENIKQFTIWGDAIKEWFLSIPGKINEFLSTWKENITKWFDETKEKIKEKLDGWWEKISNWFTSAPGKITGFLSNWWENMKKWFNEAKEKIKGKLDEWWSTIKSWFSSFPNKPEVRNAGSNMVNKVAAGAKDKKGDFIDKLGKIIVDVAGAALTFAAVALLATGREVVKRMIKGLGEVSLKKAGQKIVQGLIDGIKSMYGNVTKVVRGIAEKIRDFFPFSPAKEGPLKDLNKIDFFSSIRDSLMKASSKLRLPTIKIGDEIMKNISQVPNFDISSASGNNSGAINITGPMNFYGIEDMPAFMQEMRTTIKRYGGKFG